MTQQSITQQSIDRIRLTKFNLNPNTELTERIKLLQREMVKLSFQKNRSDDMNLVMNEIKRLRGILHSRQADWEISQGLLVKGGG